ncbi:coenzyme F420-reducing hydrogenase, gamma subunit [Beggiatoa alba B18LD]|uniref:Coenzyme F420-reducing hydrogenase, gamma subunit n=1 Tax=Beggiatoa alba B18LD TaxID=395493 RepID=I3CK81_9GAMM|nr:sulfhydrogenase subunit delta [Beggiatoa alba]EIJ44024.1 coenzyme F420-reducing hydrogenase, gamma subunit [Beggiatoa alba B18LD]
MSVMTRLQSQYERPTVAVHKFSSCDGCQLAFLNLGETLIKLTELVDIVHFVEAGANQPERAVDIAFVEGSISTPEEAERIKAVRQNSRYLIAIGACAIAGGIQALRNGQDVPAWTRAVYQHPEAIESLATATSLAQHVRVDFELQGCPINSFQLLSAIRALLFGVEPPRDQDKLCAECKRSGKACVMVTQQLPCMGAVTRTGCGVLCPHQSRDCYACYGPAENVNTQALIQQFQLLGVSPSVISQRFALFNNQSPAFARATQEAKNL